MVEEMRKTGIDIIGDVPWGTHLCQFYQTKEDLVDILVSYLKAGLENNEFCLWVTSEPLKVEDAKTSLEKAVGNLDNYIKKGQIEILDASQWYTESGKFEPDKVLQGWAKKENQAIKKGFEGLRVTGNTLWLEKKDWRKFTDYEAVGNNVIGKYRIIAICSYSLDKCGSSEIIDVVSNHQSALIRREGKWELIESADRKRAEKELLRIRAAVDDATDAIIITDPNRKAIYINMAFGYLLGYTLDMINEAGLDSVYFDRDLAKEVFKSILDRNGWAGEVQMISREGRLFPALLRGTAVLDDELNVIGMLFIHTDITERNRMEEELSQKNEELENFVYTISHDLKSPVITLQGFVSALQEDYGDKLGEEAKGYLGFIRDASAKMGGLIKDLLELSRVGRVVNPEEEMDFSAVVDESLKVLRPRIEEARIELVVADQFPVVRCDRRRMVQVMENLLSNAVKFMGDNLSPRIEIGCREEDGFHRFWVEDNGIGIDHQYHGKIFEIFRSLKEVEDAEGTGVGLTIVQRIIEHHGGRIWVESAKGEGSTFSFVLPKQ